MCEVVSIIAISDFVVIDLYQTGGRKYALLTRLAFSLAFSLARAFFVLSLLITCGLSLFPSPVTVVGPDSAAASSLEFALLFRGRLRLGSIGTSTLFSCRVRVVSGERREDVDATFEAI